MKSATKHNLWNDIYYAIQVRKMSSINATPASSGIVHREQDWLGVYVWVAARVMGWASRDEQAEEAVGGRAQRA